MGQDNQDNPELADLQSEPPEGEHIAEQGAATISDLDAPEDGEHSSSHADTVAGHDVKASGVNASEEAPESASQPVEDTVKSHQNQEEDKDSKTLAGRLDQRLYEVAQLMVEREKLLLACLAYDIPTSYYNSWKEETNRSFTQLVRLKNRKERVIGLKEAASDEAAGDENANTSFAQADDVA